jgi:hypothetical protein
MKQIIIKCDFCNSRKNKDDLKWFLVYAYENFIHLKLNLDEIPKELSQNACKNSSDIIYDICSQECLFKFIQRKLENFKDKEKL